MICFTRRYKEKKERKEKGKRVDGIVSIKSIRASHELHTIRSLLFCIHRIFRTESFENDNKDVGPFDFVNMTTIERVQSRQFRRGKKTYSNFLSVPSIGIIDRINLEKRCGANTRLSKQKQSPNRIDLIRGRTRKKDH